NLLVHRVIPVRLEGCAIVVASDQREIERTRAACEIDPRLDALQARNAPGHAKQARSGFLSVAGIGETEEDDGSHHGRRTLARIAGKFRCARAERLLGRTRAGELDAGSATCEPGWGMSAGRGEAILGGWGHRRVGGARSLVLPPGC